MTGRMSSWRLKIISRACPAVLPIVLSTLVFAGCGHDQPSIPKSATCDQLLATDPQLLLHIGPVVKLVKSLSGPENADARASTTASICIDAQTSGRGTTPVATVVEQTKTTCSDWLASSTTEQMRLVQALVGTVNLSLRVEGAIATCTKASGTTPVAGEIWDIATSYSTPVPVDESRLPRTLDPSDPHQCFERTSAAPGDASNEAWIQAGLADCVAMGF